MDTVRIETDEEFDRALQTMLALRFDLSQLVLNMSRHDALMVQQTIHEIDGYLTLQAPTDKVH